MRRYFYMLAVALVVLAAGSCNIFNDIGNAECSAANGASCTTGGSPAGLVCASATTIYFCNIDNSAYQTPSSKWWDPFPPSTCGLGFCANSSNMAKNQAAAYTGVSSTDPLLACINTGTTTEAGFQTLFQAIAQIPGVDVNDFDALCVVPPGVTYCQNPCDDGQGGSLQSVGQYCNTGEGMAPVPGGSQCCAGLTCSSIDTEGGICQGTLPKCSQQSPPQTNWQGLDTPTLRKIAIANKIDGCDTQKGVTQSRTIGVAFERWALTTLGAYPDPPNPGRNTMSFMSQERKNNTGGLPASVIPELVGDQPMFPQSIFYEVKAVTGNLTPGASNWQIVGLLDVANTFPTMDAGPHPPPVVYLITTSNTTVTAGLLSYGNMWNVAVWQQKVLYDANGGSNPNLILGPANCLSPPALCMASALTLPHPGPPVSTLTSPSTPSSALIVPGDPDPAEVD